MASNTESNNIINDSVKLHESVCRELNELYDKKNHDYGDSFHKSYEEWGLTMAAIRLGDKYSRFCSLIKAEAEVKDESIRDTLIDLANYAIMTVMELEQKGKEMDEYHVGCGAFGIYSGTLNSKNKNLWQNKTECTDEAMCAVAQYLLQSDKCMMFNYKGKRYKLCVTEIEQEEKEF